MAAEADEKFKYKWLQGKQGRKSVPVDRPGVWGCGLRRRRRTSVQIT